MASSSTTIRHGWPRTAPPKLPCEAPAQYQKEELARKSRFSVPYTIPRPELSSDAVRKQIQARSRPRYSLNCEISSSLHNIPKNRTSLPGNMPSRSTTCNRRAVLIGATYSGTRGISYHSDGINHVSHLFRFLTETLRFQKDNVWVLTDAPEKVTGCPVKLGATRRNILTALKWLVTRSKSGDILFLGFSGLGGTITKQVPDNADISVDCFLPSDYPASPPIPESELSSLFARELHSEASLTAVLDSRDASKILRLPHIQTVHSTSRSKFVVTETLERHQGQLQREKQGGIGELLLRNRMKEEYKQMTRKIAEEQCDILASTFSRSGKVVAFGIAGASKQQQKTSRFKPMPIGTLTEAFVNCVSQCIAEGKEITYQSVLLSICLTLPSKRNSQLPHISSSHRLDVSSSFALYKENL